MNYTYALVYNPHNAHVDVVRMTSVVSILAETTGYFGDNY